MNVRVLLFAGLRDRVGQEEWRPADLPERATVADLLRRLEEEWPATRGYPYQVARNRQLVDRTCTLAEGDELALLPPVSGG